MGGGDVTEAASAGGSALSRWRRQLEMRAIPQRILDAAPESPYGFSPELFRSRATDATASAPSPSTLRALEALPAGGSVLDVGCGGGAASLPLAGRAGRIVGVDGSSEMLDELISAARPLGLPVDAVPGRWPDVMEQVAPADVVVCHHVLYNVQDLAPFVRALEERADRRVVIELTDQHPLGWMTDLWDRFHGLAFPSGPTVEDATAALGELGIEPRREDRDQIGPRGGFARRKDAVAMVRRRLCLPAERDAEVAAALGDRLAEHDTLWSAGPPNNRLVTLWWDRA